MNTNFILNKYGNKEKFKIEKIYYIKLYYNSLLYTEKKKLKDSQEDNNINKTTYIEKKLKDSCDRNKIDKKGISTSISKEIWYYSSK